MLNYDIMILIFDFLDDRDRRNLINTCNELKYLFSKSYLLKKLGLNYALLHAINSKEIHYDYKLDNIMPCLLYNSKLFINLSMNSNPNDFLTALVKSKADISIKLSYLKSGTFQTKTLDNCLHLAIRTGKNKLVYELVKKKSAQAGTLDPFLLSAVLYNKPKLVRYLVDQGADPLCYDRRLLFRACDYCDVTLVLWFTGQGLDLFSNRNHGFFCACRSGNLNVIDFYLRILPNYVIVRPKFIRTACKCLQFSVIKRLLPYWKGLSRSRRKLKSASLLALACELAEPKVLKLVLRLGLRNLDILEVKDFVKLCDEENYLCIELLLEAGYIPNNFHWLSDFIQNGSTLIIKLVSKYFPSTLDRILELVCKYERIELLFYFSNKVRPSHALQCFFTAAIRQKLQVVNEIITHRDKYPFVNINDFMRIGLIYNIDSLVRLFWK